MAQIGVGTRIYGLLGRIFAVCPGTGGVRGGARELRRSQGAKRVCAVPAAGAGEFEPGRGGSAGTHPRVLRSRAWMHETYWESQKPDSQPNPKSPQRSSRRRTSWLHSSSSPPSTPSRLRCGRALPTPRSRRAGTSRRMRTLASAITVAWMRCAKRVGAGRVPFLGSMSRIAVSFAACGSCVALPMPSVKQRRLSGSQRSCAMPIRSRWMRPVRTNKNARPHNNRRLSPQLRG